MGLPGALVCLTQNGPQRAFWTREALHTPGPTSGSGRDLGSRSRLLEGLTRSPDQPKSLGVYALQTARAKTASGGPNLTRTKTRYLMTRRVRHLEGLSGVLGPARASWTNLKAGFLTTRLESTRCGRLWRNGGNGRRRSLGFAAFLW